jgi:hypothetical protein
LTFNAGVAGNDAMTVDHQAPIRCYQPRFAVPVSEREKKNSPDMRRRQQRNGEENEAEEKAGLG